MLQVNKELKLQDPLLLRNTEQHTLLLEHFLRLSEEHICAAWPLNL